MLSFATRTPSSCGIVELDDQHIVQWFYEKLMNLPGNMANGALYMFEPSLLYNNYLRLQRRCDPQPDGPHPVLA